LKIVPQYKKILIIDDSEAQLYISQFIINKHALSESILTFHSAQSALKYLNSIKDIPEEYPDLILLDISMPEMDGFEFLDVYNSIQGMLKDTCPVAMLSSSTNSKDTERAKTYPQVKGYFVKPFNDSTIAEELANLHHSL
jgi:CheY-like chemotaxis protein